MIDLTKEKPVSVERVAARFGVHRRTVEKWFGAGLERIKLNGRVFTTLAALNRFAVHNERSATNPHRTDEQDYRDATRGLELEFGRAHAS